MWQVFVNVDEQGNILVEYSGRNIIAEDQYDYFFLVNEEVAMHLNEYKVSLNGFKPSLVLKGSAL
ncbi:hypothetical protein VKA52_02695 [Halobacillus sp. HZG1]|uniref:hypothetical protein n=1 Tax=Halobacillus sp. HZG1 TaxID=3111769 RepID=UPI002DBDB3BE|nr:hypothetical protein [Halobacillus sp. HZG1]MEC3882633.1 hypothetical protein [Halobacillus sp. HZG1]